MPLPPPYSTGASFFFFPLERFLLQIECLSRWLSFFPSFSAASWFDVLQRCLHLIGCNSYLCLRRCSVSAFHALPLFFGFRERCCRFCRLALKRHCSRHDSWLCRCLFFSHLDNILNFSYWSCYSHFESSGHLSLDSSLSKMKIIINFTFVKRKEESNSKCQNAHIQDHLYTTGPLKRQKGEWRLSKGEKAFQRSSNHTNMFHILEIK